VEVVAQLKLEQVLAQAALVEMDLQLSQPISNMTEKYEILDEAESEVDFNNLPEKSE
jgi:hypothetical protein